jgi:hypothetical protein
MRRDMTQESDAICVWSGGVRVCAERRLGTPGECPRIGGI